MELFKAGDVSVATIIEREGPQRTAQQLLPSSDYETARAYMRELDPFVYLPGGNQIYNTYQSFVLRIDGKIIIIDTCTGENAKGRPAHFNFNKQPWLDNLAAEGIAFEDVDMVICTHQHVDHVGWNTRLEGRDVSGRWVPTFPNAKYIFGRAEYEYWEDQVRKGRTLPGMIWTDSCLPVVEAGQADLVEADHRLSNRIWLQPTFGHTPGHFCVNVDAGEGQRIIFSGDLMHHPVQCREPDWSSFACEDPAQAAITRREFLEEVADTGTIIVPEHFPFPTAGRVERDGDRFRYRFLRPWSESF